MKLTKNDIIKGTQRAQENTFGNRYTSADYSFKVENNVLRVWANGVTVYIDSIDEVVLYVIKIISFVPTWLITQFYSAVSSGAALNIDDKINNWIAVGLVWKEPDVTGLYVRPTRGLFKLFNNGIDDTGWQYTELPFNMLRHTIAESKVLFDILSGVSNIVKDNFTLPRPSFLGLPPNNAGTIVWTEKEFKAPNMFTQRYIDELESAERAIEEGVKNGAKITKELENPRYFVIAKHVDNTGTLRKDWDYHLPDLVIPVVRNSGVAQSIAIEVELTNKKIVAYRETVKRYKDNIKYSKVYWLCRDPDIAKSLREAYDLEGGCGKCEWVIEELNIPSPIF